MTSLNYRLSQVETNLVDYASWDETYNFVQNQNQQFVDTNFIDSTFQNLKLNIVAIMDNNKNVVYMQSYDLNNSGKSLTSQETKQTLSSYIGEYSSRNTAVSGLILLDNQPMMMAIAPILTGIGEGPARGGMLFGKYFR